MRMTMRQARLYYGLSQSKIARELGIHPKTYARLEDRADIITVAQYRRFCEILGVKRDEIFLP